jgi:hypothetical protein
MAQQKPSVRGRKSHKLYIILCAVLAIALIAFNVLVYT